MSVHLTHEKVLLLPFVTKIKSVTKIKTTKAIASFFIIVLTMFLVACSGGETGTGLTENQADSGDGSSNDGSTGNNNAITIGLVASIDNSQATVNGRSFETGNSSIVVGNTLGSQSDLAVGMVVVVDGAVDENSQSGTASVIEFENEVEGIVLANDYPDLLNVMGQVVIINNDTVFESHVSGVASLKDIRKKDHVEVSGFPTHDGAIFATRVIVKQNESPDNQIIVKGFISSISSVNMEFEIGSLTIAYDESVYSGDIASLQMGLLVRVIGHSGYRGNNRNELLFADQIQPIAVTDLQISGTKVEIEGIVAADVDVDQFKLGRFTIEIQDTTELFDGEVIDITRGKKLNVVGVFADETTLVADKIEFRQFSEIKLKAGIESIDYMQGVVALLGTNFQINKNTIFKHSDNFSATSIYNMAHLFQGNNIEISAYYDPAMDIYIATKLKIENNESVIIEGIIERINGDILSMQTFDIDISNLPPGQFRQTSIGRKVGLTVNYDVDTQSLVATQYQYDN